MHHKALFYRTEYDSIASGGSYGCLPDRSDLVVGSSFWASQGFNSGFWRKIKENQGNSSKINGKTVKITAETSQTIPNHQKST